MTQENRLMLETAMDAVKIGGTILMESFGKIKQDQIDLKGSGDYVTQLDHQSEQAIIRRIRKTFSDHHFLAEESGDAGQSSQTQWCIDPLDGTANYVQGIPFFSISIAVLLMNEVQIGVIYNPYCDEMFWAIRNEGAFMNGQKIHVSEKTDLAYVMLASGFPWRSKTYIDAYLASFKDIFLKAAGIRRLGSAALDLAYTACGRFDGFWEMALKPWDIAAGVLMVEEAGGKVTDFKGGNNYMASGSVLASNRSLHHQLVTITRKHLSNTMQ
jgi:myo-inositol-1(or 4)-monophosphatase